MAEPDPTIALPFDPSEPPPDFDPATASGEERAVAALHAHYYHTRQALDLIDTSRYQAILVPGISQQQLDEAELQAMADQELAADEDDAAAD
jgi:hypothetical protein